MGEWTSAQLSLGGHLMTMARLLIVEDERIVAWDLRRRLTKLGYTVLACVGSGREAVQLAGELRPDLVLMDVGLSAGMNGLEAAAHIQASASIPIIYLSGTPEGGTSPSLTVQKPVNDQNLHQTIRRALATMPQIPRTDDAAGELVGHQAVPR